MRNSRYRVDDNCSAGEGVELAGGEDSVWGPDQPTASSVAFCGDATVEVRRQQESAGLR
ncbi:MAG: hypothetical protein ACC658_03590 [Acidimicrobiia bacterium]